MLTLRPVKKDQVEEIEIKKELEMVPKPALIVIILLLGDKMALNQES